MREGPALGVLPGDAHIAAIGEERCKSESLGVSPIDAGVVNRVAAARQRTLQRWMQLESRWPLQELFIQGHELLGTHSRFAWLVRARYFLTRDRVFVRIRILRVGEDLLQLFGNLAIHRLHLVLGDDALANKTSSPYFAWRRVRLDQVVQLGLGKA